MDNSILYLSKIALRYEKPRNSTAICEEETHVAIIERKFFVKLLKKYYKSKKQKLYEFLD